jgi:ATP-dependent DNA helicase RecQ
VHSGEDVSYTFKFEEFIRHFKLDSVTALYALKALEGDGWIFFNERNFTPSTLSFTTTKRGLHDFQNTYPQHEELLTTLLRTYEGIFDFPVFISELLVAGLLKKGEDVIKSELKKIDAFGIIKYTPQNDVPQIIFRKNRVAAHDLLMNLKLYHKRKEAFIQRVEKMIDYTKCNGCRSLFINHYFGDKETSTCTVCDNCLAAKTITIGTEEFTSISNHILKLVANKQLSIHQLKEALTGINKQKAWRVLQFLQAENKIILDKDGFLKTTAVA